MICSKCGHEFSVGIFCPECGTKYETPEEEKASLEREEQERLVKEEAEHLARKKAEAERLEREQREAEEARAAKEKAEAERLGRERKVAEEKQKEEERIAKERVEAERLRQEQQDLQERTYNGVVYASREEAATAKADNEQIESLKKKLLSTKKQDERRKMIAEFGNPPVTPESRQRYDALKEKSEIEKPKSILINWIYGITVLIAIILYAVMGSGMGAMGMGLMIWGGFGFYIWPIWKIVLFVKSKNKNYYLNIKHI